MKKLSQNKLKEIALRKISYDEVAENSSLSKNTINSLVNSQNFNPTLETLTKLSFSCGQDCVRLCQKNNYFNNTEVKKISSIKGPFPFSNHQVQRKVYKTIFLLLEIFKT